MRICELLSIHATICFISLFTVYARSTVRPTITLDVSHHKQTALENRSGTDIDSVIISSKRQAPFDPNWPKQLYTIQNTIPKNVNGILFYVPKYMWPWSDRSSENVLYNTRVKDGPSLNHRPVSDLIYTRPMWLSAPPLINPYGYNDKQQYPSNALISPKKSVQSTNDNAIILNPSYIWSANDKSAQGMPAIVPIHASRVEQTNETTSRVKCKEYAEDVGRTSEVLPLLPAASSSHVVEVRNEICDTANPLITGGTVAKPGVYAHMVALGRRAIDGAFIFHCGGSLISHRWILSAAHCTHGPNGNPTLVRLGAHNLKDQRSGVTISVKRTIRHPAYVPPAMYADIALLQLQSAVGFSALVKPACLYQRYAVAPSQAWISGWGTSEFSGEHSDVLQQARLDILDNLSCAMHYKTSMPVPRGVSPSMICAGDRSGGWKRDTCQGDSGGPLQIIHSKKFCLFEIVGVTSFGEACANKESPGVYTRVAHYLQWIEDIVWPKDSPRQR